MYKAQYIETCRSHGLPLCFQSFWLDALCGAEDWNACVATDKGGAVTGVLPYYMRRRWGVLTLSQPPLTSYGGPWLFYPDNLEKRHSRYTFEKHVCETLIDQLPKAVFYRQNFHPDVQNWYPFYLRGFYQTTRYTYCLEPAGDLDACYRAFKSSVRANLRKMERSLYVRRADAQAEQVFGWYGAAMRRKGLRPPCDAERFARLHKALQQRGQSACWVAADQSSGHLQAGLYLVYDDQRASILLSALTDATISHGALHGLIWEAIQFAAQKKLLLDFEGSMDPGVEHLFRAFGGVMTPYFAVWKAGNKWVDWLYGV